MQKDIIMTNPHPAIKSLVQGYLQEYELESQDDPTNFELFTNYCVFSSFNRTGEKIEIDTVHTGKPRDTGLDGIGILIDDILVNSEDHAESVIGNNKNRTFELKFIFVQAKLKSSFELPVIEKTINAVQDFFANYREQEPLYSRSEQVKEKAELAAYLLRNYIQNIRDKPRCSIYYTCVSGKSADSKIESKKSKLIKKLENELVLVLQ